MSSEVGDTTKAVFARNLGAARRAAGLTQDEVAARAGVSRATIVQLESGGGDPLLSTVAQIAAALETRPMVLLIGSEDVQALARLVEDGDELESIREQITKADALEMHKLLATRLPKGERRVAEIGVTAVQAAGFAGAGVAAAAAIGTLLIPGLGTAIGGLLGGALAAGSAAAKRATDTDEDAKGATGATKKRK